MRGATGVEDRGREKGSGIGMSSGEGGTSEESAIREREMQRDGKSGRETWRRK